MKGQAHLFSTNSLLMFIAVMLVSQCSFAKTGITSNDAPGSLYYSAVSPEFPNGLHTQFLNYIAGKLDIQLSIGGIPFARRVVELDKGKLDLIVGLSDVGEIPVNCVRIHPAYESMTTSLFTSRGNPKQLNGMASLDGMIVAITRRSKIEDVYPSFKKARVVEVESLRQKIEMLALGRVDAFIHLKASTQVYLKNQGLEEKIELVPNTDTRGFNLHLAINKYSPLWQRKAELEQVIADGVKNGDFAAIRAKHYANQ